MRHLGAFILLLLTASCGDNALDTAAQTDAGESAIPEADADTRCYKFSNLACYGDGAYWMDSCGEPHKLAALCEQPNDDQVATQNAILEGRAPSLVPPTSDSCYRGYCCEPAVTEGTFAIPSHASYVNWQFEAESYSEIRYDLHIDNMPGEEVGMFLAHNGHIDETQYYFGLQTTMAKPGEGRVGRGVIFSRWGTRDLDNTRAADGGFTQSSGHEGDFVGVRALYPWQAGDYSLRLTRGEGDANGDWFELTIESHETGIITDLGAMRFPRKASEAASMSGGGPLMTEVYSMPETHEGTPEFALVPRWRVSAMMYADGVAATEANLSYPAYPNDQEFPNANGVFDRENKNVVLDFGGDTMRCAPAGTLF